MKFYCGLDLSARDCHVCVIDSLAIFQVFLKHECYWLMEMSLRGGPYPLVNFARQDLATSRRRNQKLSFL